MYLTPFFRPHFFGLGVYEIIPGFIAAWAAIYFVSLATESQGEYRAVPAA